MKISILLPYKENFSPEYPGAVSLFVYETTRISNFKKNITVFGNTNFKKKFGLIQNTITFLFVRVMISSSQGFLIISQTFISDGFQTLSGLEKYRCAIPDMEVSVIKLNTGLD